MDKARRQSKEPSHIKPPKTWSSFENVSLCGTQAGPRTTKKQLPAKSGLGGACEKKASLDFPFFDDSVPSSVRCWNRIFPSRDKHAESSAAQRALPAQSKRLSEVKEPVSVRGSTSMWESK